MSSQDRTMAVASAPAASPGSATRWVPVLAAVALLSGLLLALGRAPQREELPSPWIGRAAPLLPPPTAGAWPQGQVRVLSVWASWCAPCREEWPLLQGLSAQGIPVLGLAYKDPKAREWLAAQGQPFAAWLDDPGGRAALEWGVRAVPETFVIDAQGVVRFHHAGPLTPEVVQRWRSLLAVKEIAR